MNRKAIIVWHHYKNGKLVDFSITEFTGDDAQLVNFLKNNALSGERWNEGKTKGERRGILHQVVLL